MSTENDSFDSLTELDKSGSAVANRTQIKLCTILKQSTCLKKTIKLKI